MSQNIFSTIVPTTTSGNQLATILNDFKDAVVSGFSGVARPAELQDGGYWIDITDDLSGLWYFKIWDGVQDTTVFTLNKNTGLATISSADSLFQIINVSESSVGSILRFIKERNSDGGQTEDGDTIGEIQFTGTRDDSVTTLQARIKAISDDNVTALASGAFLAFEVVPEGGASIAEVMRIADGRVGIGTTDPQNALHVVGTGARLEKNSDDAIGPILNIKKTRIAGTGEVLSGDALGTLQFIGEDTADTEVGGAQIVVSTRQALTPANHGSKIVIRNKKLNTNVYSDQLTIEDDVTVNQNLIVTGNLTVNGTTTSVNSTSLEITDANVIVNNGGTQAAANAAKAGVRVEVSDATDAQLGYDSAKASKFVIGEVGSESEVVTATHTQTLTNKTLTSPVINTPTGITKSDVGLSNVDNTSDATKNSASVTLTNKTLTSPVINNASIVTPTRLDVKQDTKANLITYAATASNGQIVFATDEKLMYQVVDSALVAVGGGSSALSTIFQLDGSEEISAWTSGDNATFLGGGTISGTFVEDTTTQLNGASGYKYTQAAGSLDDYISSAAQAVPLRFRGNTATCIFAYTYDGGSSDIEPVIWDVTNSTKLTTSSNLLPSTGTNASVYKVNVLIPSNCTHICFGFQTKILNSGKILKWDDVVLSSDATLYSDTSVVTEWQSYTPTFTNCGTSASVNFQYRKVGSSIQIQGTWVGGTPVAAEMRVSLPSGMTASGDYSALVQVGHGGSAGSTNSFSVNIETGSTYMVFGNAGQLTKSSATTIISAGQSLSIFASMKIAGLSASNPQIITASESFSTDTASLVYAGSASYTEATLTNAPVGTFITFTYGAASNTKTQTIATAPTQTTADMSSNGIRLYTRLYSAASVAATPSTVMIQIGKNHKAFNLELYKNTTKALPGSVDYTATASSSVRGVPLRLYNPATGVLTIDLGYNYRSDTAEAWLVFSDLSTGTDGYFVANASKSPALVGVPQVLPRIATISEVQASGTHGGTFTSGSYVTRVLNTLVDSANIVTSLSSNQFILPAGEYYIEASAPGSMIAHSKIKLRNITDSSDAIVGTANYIAPVNNITGNAILSGRLIITASKTFELQHRCSISRATDGLGVGNAFGESEIFSSIKITKVK